MVTAWEYRGVSRYHGSSLTGAHGERMMSGKGGFSPVNSQPEFRWNRLLATPEEASELLEAASFIIRPPAARDWSGTAFFFTRDGLALTADHNLRPDFPQRIVAGIYRGRPLTFEWLEEWSSTEADIAVIRLQTKPEETELECLDVAYLDATLPLHARRQFWGGREVCIFGYPIRGTALEGQRIEGAIDTALPLIEVIEADHGYGDKKAAAWRFNIHAHRPVSELEGLSGAAIFDLARRCVVGVEGSYLLHEEVGEHGRSVRYVVASSLVRGSEVAQLVDKVPEVASYFRPLFGGREELEDAAVFSSAERQECIDAEVALHLAHATRRGKRREWVISYLVRASREREDPTERYWAFIALGMIGGPEAEGAILDGLKDPNEFPRGGAQTAWETITQRKEAS